MSVFANPDAAQRSLEQSVIGGGSSVEPSLTRSDADVVVSETSEFLRADRNDVVYLADDEVVQVSDEAFNVEGTKLIGGRHKEGVEPGTVDVRSAGPNSASYRGAIRANSGSRWHVEGIKILGPLWDESKADDYYDSLLEPKPVDKWPGYAGINKDRMDRSERDAFRKSNMSRGINAYVSGSVKNIEAAGFLHAAVSFGAKSYTPTVRVEESFLHNCPVPGYGYAVNHFNGDLLSERNFYDATRHAITGFGWPDCEFTTRKDIYGVNWMLTPVDMHNLAENKQSGLTAGKRLDVENCTFLTDSQPRTPTWYSSGNCAAVGIRGHPASGAPGYSTVDCQFVHSSESRALAQRNVSFPTGWSRSGNEYGGPGNWSGGKGAPIDWDVQEPSEPVDSTPPRLATRETNRKGKATACRGIAGAIGDLS